METFRVVRPTAATVPIVLSVPHCGTLFPSDIRNEFVSELIENPDDTDWFVDRLYDFAPSTGITVVAATYSRWVIDLNRDPAGAALYSDGRLTTGLCPTTTFLGEPIYRDRRTTVDEKEIKRRIDNYFVPYHTTLRQTLSSLKEKFEHALLWDCHSIRQLVPTIRKEKFPDLILGDADETSASPKLIAVASEVLGNAGYSFSHNEPFKGGYITRHFGKPATGIHAIQLEMSKVNYMDNSETKYDEARAGEMAAVLKRCLSGLMKALQQ